MKVNIIFGITPELAETIKGLSAAIASPNIAGIMKEAAETAARLRKAPPNPTYQPGGVSAGKGLKMAGEGGPEVIAPGTFRFVDPAMANPEAEDQDQALAEGLAAGLGEGTPGFRETMEAFEEQQAVELEAAHKANLKTDAELQADAAAVPGLNDFQNKPTGAPAPLTDEELEEQRKEIRRARDRERARLKREAEAKAGTGKQPTIAKIDPEPDPEQPASTNGAAAKNGQPVTEGVPKDALIAATQNAIFKDPANRERIREYLDSAEVGKVTELSEEVWPAFISFAEAL